MADCQARGIMRPNPQKLLHKGKAGYMFFCLILALGFFILGLFSYYCRNNEIGTNFYLVSNFLNSSPSLFHGAFFIALVTACDGSMKDLERNALLCVFISSALEVSSFRIGWNPEIGFVPWKGVFDLNDILFGAIGIGLSYGILKMSYLGRFKANA